MNECGLIASMQEEYNRLLAAMDARSDLAIAAYLTPRFIATDVRGREETARQMVTRIDSRGKGASEFTTVLSARSNGKSITVQRKSLERSETTVAGEKRAVETHTLLSDTWIDSDGALLLQRSMVDRVDTYVNGTHVSELKSATGM
jgi:hypothetical protein